jgi:hypothetical protein
MAQRLPPELAIRLYIIGMEFSDQPNKDQIADEMRRVIGERDPNKPMTPEEAQQLEEQMQAQAETLAMQRRQAQLVLEEQSAKVEKIHAEIEALRARAGDGGLSAEHEQRLMQIQADADRRLEAMAEKLRSVQADAAKQIVSIRQESDARLEAARIDADAKVRVAEINAVAKTALEGISARIEEIAQAVGKNTPVATGTTRNEPEEA